MFKKLLQSIFTNISNKSSCSACHKVFSDSKMKEYDGLPFCKKHFQALSSGEVKVIDTLITSPDHPEQSVGFHDRQVALMKKGKVSYIKMSYLQDENEILTKMELKSQL